MWSLVEPMVAERITLALEQRREPEEPEDNDKAFTAELRRWQRFMRDLREQRDALKPGLERAALDMDISDYEKQRPRPGPGFLRRKMERERQAFMRKLADRYGDKLRPRPIG